MSIPVTTTTPVLNVLQHAVAPEAFFCHCCNLGQSFKREVYSTAALPLRVHLMEVMLHHPLVLPVLRVLLPGVWRSIPDRLGLVLLKLL